MSRRSKRKDPIQMQGSFTAVDFFEGWYYRMIAPTGECLSLIPGYSTSSQDAHCFLQYILTDLQVDGMNSHPTGYLRHPIKSFYSERTPFLLQVGESRFYRNGVQIHIETTDLSIHGSVSFQNMTPIQTSWFSPNIMGWFAYFPGMECYHGVISMEHHLQGSIAINGRNIDFTGGKGYLEKDWGTSFPERYVWIQCNQFQRTGTSLMCSVAEIPFLGTRFQGHIINLIVDGEEMRFATYNRSKIILLESREREVLIEAEHRRWHLRIQGRLEQEGALKAPNFGQMGRIIKEGLQGSVSIELRDRRSGSLFRDQGRNAGIEIVGCQDLNH